jgi:hypothetical protein
MIAGHFAPKRHKLIERIARALGGDAPLAGLTSRLAPTDLQSLLLHVMRERSAAKTPAELLSQFERTRMLRPSRVDARLLLDLERGALACASEFEAIELSPVAPLGTNVVLGRIDQNNSLATVRGVEVLADPTTAAALECARRRRAGIATPIRLCSRSRVLRLQPLTNPEFSPHFALFSLVTSTRNRGGFDAELEALDEQLATLLSVIARWLSLSEASAEVSLSDTARDPRQLERAESRVFARLATAYPDVAFRVDTTREQGRNYYAGWCLSIHIRDADGRRINIADGGFTDWTQRLLSNAKERLLVSAIGLDLLARAKHAHVPGPTGDWQSWHAACSHQQGGDECGR